MKCGVFVIITEMIITLKGAIREILQSLHCAMKCLHSSQGAIMCKSHVTHRAHIACIKLCATWYEGTARLLSLMELKWHLFWLYLLAETSNWCRRGGNRSDKRKPQTTSFRKCHILKPINSSPDWDSNPQSSIGSRRLLSKQTWQPLHHTLPQFVWQFGSLWYSSLWQRPSYG